MKPHTVELPQLTDTDWCITVNGAPVEIYDRVVDILDAHRDIGITDTNDGASILTWETTQQIAVALAGDPVLAQLFRRQGGGAA